MSIYDAIGGAPAVQAAVDDFYTRVTADPRLSGFFSDVDMRRLKSHQRAFIAAAIGGPQIYEGRDMAAAHAGLDIADAHFDAVVGHLVDTLTALGVPEDTIATIGSTLAPLRADIVTASAHSIN
ncbi:group I truncated hemoglobin [Actinomadura rugatobispora]|uniref:Group 1 truncated hemoglobin n=1 Tax=Actinomadura rugatobispora TaxID=1994 RepID=A0ABW0ZZ96_9ACTN|nr:group 1 truncated hemoglobin GlbN [Actinomadura rugatobispora]